VTTPKRVLICYDREDDDTLPAIRNKREALGDLAIDFVRNLGRGTHDAVLSGLTGSKAPFAVVLPADDDYNAGIIDVLVTRQKRRQHRLLQPLHGRRQYGRLPLAEGALRARRQFHALSLGAAADARRQLRLSPVFAAHDG
jgi:hypothetical protein